jgi:hypothetical protein
MNSKARNFTFNVGTRPANTAVATNPAAAAKLTTTTTTTQAVLSININLKMAPSFDNQCMIDNQQPKSKRRALDNLTNATGFAAGTAQQASSSSAASNQPCTSKDAAAAAAVAGVTTTRKASMISVATNKVFASKIKKTESVTKKTSTLSK